MDDTVLDSSCTGDRAEALERAVAVLDAAAGAADADLARVCRGALDALRAHDRRPAEDQRRQPLPAPRWACRTVREDDRTIHETVHSTHPWITTEGGRQPLPTDLSLSVADHLVDGRWIRARPTIQMEGGSYSLADARQLRAALDDLLCMAEPEPVRGLLGRALRTRRVVARRGRSRWS